MPETWVRPVMHAVTPSVRPRSMNRLPSVTMKDGRPVLHDDQAVERSRRRRTRRRRSSIASHTGQPQKHRGNGDQDAGKADHRADREIELAGDHQQRHRRGEDAELGRDLEEVDDALGAEQAAAAGDEAKNAKTRTVPAAAPSSGRLSSRPSSETLRTRSSRTSESCSSGDSVIGGWRPAPQRAGRRWHCA